MHKFDEPVANGVRCTEAACEQIHSHRLAAALLPALEDKTGTVVIDLSEVSFMDLTGIRVLLTTHQRLTSEKRQLSIACREDGQVHRLLARAGMLTVATGERSRGNPEIGAEDHDRSRPTGRRVATALETSVHAPRAADAAEISRRLTSPVRRSRWPWHAVANRRDQPGLSPARRLAKHERLW
jgi:anti-anti-sigma factor